MEICNVLITVTVMKCALITNNYGAIFLKNTISLKVPFSLTQTANSNNDEIAENGVTDKVCFICPHCTF